MAIMKHVGSHGNKPCVVVFREVPNEPENCLIVETGNLGPQIHDDLMMAVQSAEAQESNDISQVLARKTFTDGSNMLNALHFSKYITKVPVNQVSLTPTPAQSVPLAEVNAEIRKIESRSDNTNTNPDRLATAETANVNKPVEPVKTDAPDTSLVEDDAAKGLLLQSELMAEDAQRMIAEAEAKKEQAYQLDPSLRPKKGPGRPRKTDSSS